MVNHEWIMEVLEDIQEYADLNGLRTIAEALEKARRTSIQELVSRNSIASCDAYRSCSYLSIVKK